MFQCKPNITVCITILRTSLGVLVRC